MCKCGHELLQHDIDSDDAACFICICEAFDCTAETRVQTAKDMLAGKYGEKIKEALIAELPAAQVKALMGGNDG